MYSHDVAMMHTPPAAEHSHGPNTGVTSESHSIQRPEIVAQDHDGAKGMKDKLSLLWAGSEGHAYKVVTSAIFEQWTKYKQPEKEFLEKAVELLVKFQDRTMEHMLDTLDWLDYVKGSGIDTEKYLAWSERQYKLLASEKSRGFDNITPKQFSDCLEKADWKTCNDDSAIVNAYLLYAGKNIKPELYLGRIPLGQPKHWLAVRVNGDVLSPQEADLSNLESYGVTAVNPKTLLQMRYTNIESNERESFLFVPIGESIDVLHA